MNIEQLLAAILNPNGSQQAQPMMGAPAQQVGDHANPAALNASMRSMMAQQPQQMAPQAFAPQQASQGQPMPQSAPQAAPQPQGGGLGAIGGILQNIIAPQSAQKNQTVRWLTSQGLDPGMATVLASDKGALRQYIFQRQKGSGPTEFDQRAAAAAQYGIDPSTPEGRSFILTGKYGEEPKQTSDMQEYELAKTQGFKGTFFDYQVKMKEAGRSQVNVDTGAKLPAGYVWNDPNNQDAGVHPIAGGPATQIPSEAAGRIGLADTFLNNFDTIKQKVAGGDITGPVDAFRSRNQSSYPGAETFRQIQTGVDALQRMLTGAGMPASEASSYAFRYLPTYTDDASSMVVKLDRLKSELESIKGRVLQGRETPAPGAAPSGEAPPSTYDGDPKLWQYMTPEQRKLWQ